jgi:hypothetical protein
MSSTVGVESYDAGQRTAFKILELSNCQVPSRCIFISTMYILTIKSVKYNMNYTDC